MKRSTLLRSVFAAATLFAIFPTHSSYAVPVPGATLTSADITTANALLHDFNAIVTNTLTQNREIEGRIAVGGSFVDGGSNNVCFNGCSGNVTFGGQTYGAATIYGSASGGTINAQHGDISVQGNSTSAFELNHNGGLNITGTNSSQISDATFVRTSRPTLGGSTQNLPNGAVTTGLSTSTVFPYGSFASTFGTPLTDLANALPQIASGVTTQTLPTGQNISTTAVSTGNFGAYHYGFFTTTTASLAQDTFNSINTNGLDAVFVIVSGTGSVNLPQLAANGSDNGKLIFDFTGATSINANGQWDATILAPLATVANTGGNIEGSVFASNLTNSNELHQNYVFDGNLAGLPTLSSGGPGGNLVPEPGSLALLGIGLVGIAVRRRF